MATGGAALCLVALGTHADRNVIAALGNISALSLAVELVAWLSAMAVYRGAGVAAPLQQAPWGPVQLIGVELAGVLAPIGLFIASDIVSSASAILSLVAALCTLAGGLLMRGVVLLAGNESARRPQDYFRLAGVEQI